MKKYGLILHLCREILIYWVPEMETGTRVRVVYNGTIAESYPEKLPEEMYREFDTYLKSTVMDV